MKIHIETKHPLCFASGDTMEEHAKASQAAQAGETKEPTGGSTCSAGASAISHSLPGPVADRQPEGAVTNGDDAPELCYMRMNASPAVEKKIVRAMEKKFGKGPWFNNETVRQQTREAAFHAAGQVVSRMFLRLDVGHIISASIIPDKETVSRVFYRRNLCEEILQAYPENVKQHQGRILLIKELAGRAAQDRVATEETRVDILDSDSEEWSIDDPAIITARRISSIMAHSGMPQNRILRLAEKWTIEMLAIPQVWAATERVAGALLEKGNLTTANVDNLCGEIAGLSHRIPRWRERLHNISPRK
jgi:hypothetical protein